VAVFAVDPARGMPQFTGQFVPVGNPSCVVFLETAPSTHDE
jgi:6-phosphogluconolactonase